MPGEGSERREIRYFPPSRSLAFARDLSGLSALHRHTLELPLNGVSGALRSARGGLRTLDLRMTQVRGDEPRGHADGAHIGKTL
ncbi:hypothetical protein HLRTI_003165 [Halorhabdus tiamatea SARL4B]|uniref:Uncharacterized protein n=1 Tax=Halorhabdus tiamatea SARL4B TaxID=1033806 RepID=U2DYK5_9EURY|nr:hypothetical protein HLRTI_003165 [Halorhabdus tiamatea SARL4B]